MDEKILIKTRFDTRRLKIIISIFYAKTMSWIILCFSARRLFIFSLAAVWSFGQIIMDACSVFR